MYVANPLQKPDNVYMYTLHPTRSAMLTQGPTEAEKALAAQHWAYSQDLLAKKVVIFGGRTLVTNEDSFAIVVIQTRSEEEARAIMEGDPAVKGGLFRARLFPYEPMLIGAWPE
ncbi:MAG: YciI family protein [Thermodesulfobacteriota bacterium]|jgi:uncharacterized protein YciI